MRTFLASLRERIRRLLIGQPSPPRPTAASRAKDPGPKGAVLAEIVAATRSSESQFAESAPLGDSRTRLAFDRRLFWKIAFENGQGLPDIYNEAIRSSSAEILIFVHDDVWIEDYHLVDNLIDGLKHFDVIGVAGNRRRSPNQWGWGFKSSSPNEDPRPHDLSTVDFENISGAVAHGSAPFARVAWFGEAPAACELLDGVFMAVKRSVLLERRVFFDPQFAFHFYDLDFCRTARASGLRIGTWRIPITHRSTGAYVSSAWKTSRDAYRLKWGD